MKSQTTSSQIWTTSPELNMMMMTWLRLIHHSNGLAEEITTMTMIIRITMIIMMAMLMVMPMEKKLFFIVKLVLGGMMPLTLSEVPNLERQNSFQAT